MFEQLKGIEKEREEKTRKNVLESILKMCDVIVKKYTKKVKHDGFEAIEGNFKTYKQVMKTLKDLPEYTEADLMSFIHAKANAENPFEQDKDTLKKAVAQGLYSGCLLDLLAIRNREKGVPTNFYFDGKNNHFHYLFHLSHEADMIMLENLQGKRICYGACNYGNKTKTFIARNIEVNALLNYVALHNLIDICILENIKGTHIHTNISIQENTGIDLMIIRNISGDGAFIHTSLEGNNTIKTLLYENSSIKNVSPSHVQNIISFEYVRKQLKGHHYNKILDLVDSFEGKTPKEKIATADKIHTIYQKNV